MPFQVHQGDINQVCLRLALGHQQFHAHWRSGRSDVDESGRNLDRLPLVPRGRVDAVRTSRHAEFTSALTIGLPGGGRRPPRGLDHDGVCLHRPMVQITQGPDSDRRFRTQGQDDLFRRGLRADVHKHAVTENPMPSHRIHHSHRVETRVQPGALETTRVIDRAGSLVPGPLDTNAQHLNQFHALDIRRPIRAEHRASNRATKP